MQKRQSLTSAQLEVFHKLLQCKNFIPNKKFKNEVKKNERTKSRTV